MNKNNIKILILFIVIFVIVILYFYIKKQNKTKEEQTIQNTEEITEQDLDSCFNMLDSQEDSDKSLSKAAEILNFTKVIGNSIASDKKLLYSLAGNFAANMVIKTMSKYLVSGVTKGTIKFAAGVALKAVKSAIGGADTIALALDVTNMIMGMKWTKYPESDMIYDIYFDVNKTLNTPPEFNESFMKCLKEYIKSQTHESDEELEKQVNTIISDIKNKAAYSIAKYIPDEIDPRSNLQNVCMPISFKDPSRMLIPTVGCDSVYQDLFKEYIKNNYANMKLEQINSQDGIIKEIDLSNVCKNPINKEFNILDDKNKIIDTIKLNLDKITIPIINDDVIGTGKSCTALASEYVTRKLNKKILNTNKIENNIDILISCDVIPENYKNNILKIKK